MASGVQLEDEGVHWLLDELDFLEDDSGVQVELGACLLEVAFFFSEDDEDSVSTSLSS